MSCDEQKQGEFAIAQILENDFDDVVKERPILEPSSSSRSEQDESCSSDVDVYHRAGRKSSQKHSSELKTCYNV